MSSTLVENRGSSFHYQIQEELVAGLILTGGEIKSLRNKGGSLKGAWCRFEKGALKIMNFKIRRYKADSTEGHDELRVKELLLSKRELFDLEQKQKQGSLQIIPLEVFLKGRFAKVRLGIGTALKKHDKRAKIKEREVKLRVARAVRR